jgi:hypothetical protein
MIEQGGSCNAGLPTNHELVFKGRNDDRFLSKLDKFEDAIINSHIQSTASSGVNGCNPTYDTADPGGDVLYPGVTSDRFEINCIVQGGALGVIGYENAQSASSTQYGTSLAPNMSGDNFYSGSFNYEVSFLDKDHTLILDLDKEAELFDGIGEKGLVIIPQDSDSQIAFNIEYYLTQAGIINNPNSTLQNSNNNTPPGNLE